MPSIEDYFIINEISHVRAGKEKCVKSQNYILPLIPFSFLFPFSKIQLDLTLVALSLFVRKKTYLLR